MPAICPHCGKEIGQDAPQHCPHCGTAVPAAVEANNATSSGEYEIEPASTSHSSDSLMHFFQSMQGVDHGDSIVVEADSSDDDVGEPSSSEMSVPPGEDAAQQDTDQQEPPSAIQVLQALRADSAPSEAELPETDRPSAPGQDGASPDVGEAVQHTADGGEYAGPGSIASAHQEELPAQHGDHDRGGEPQEVTAESPGGAEADNQENAEAVAEQETDVSEPGEPQEVGAIWQPPAVAADAISSESFSRRPQRQQSSTSLIAIIATYICGAMTGFVIGKLVYGPAATSPLRKIPDYGVHQGGREWRLPSPDAAVPRGQWLEPGKKLRVGDLEVEAVALTVRPIRLTRIDPITGRLERRDTGEQSLVLVLRIRNLSENLAFVPIDELFLRESEFPEYSYIELPDGRHIGMYPLPKFSEFNLEQQTFEELPPGQTRTYWIVADPEVLAHLEDTMTWRVQLRVGGSIDRTYSTVIAVRFHVDDIQRSDGDSTT